MDCAKEIIWLVFCFEVIDAEVMGDPTLMADALFLKLTLPIYVVR